MSRLIITLKRVTCIWRFMHNTLAFMPDSSEKGRPFFKDYLSSIQIRQVSVKRPSCMYLSVSLLFCPNYICTCFVLQQCNYQNLIPLTLCSCKGNFDHLSLFYLDQESGIVRPISAAYFGTWVGKYVEIISKLDFIRSMTGATPHRKKAFLALGVRTTRKCRCSNRGS